MVGWWRGWLAPIVAFTCLTRKPCDAGSNEIDL
jgi:hypothetical protein